MDGFLVTFIRVMLLRLLHHTYRWYIYSNSFVNSIFHRPRPLRASRTKLPRHLSFLLVPDEDGRICVSASAQAVDIIARCCLGAGIVKLSVYVEDSELARKLEIEYNSLSSTRDFSLDFLTPLHAKMLLASTADSLAFAYLENHTTQIPPFSISIENLDSMIETKSPSPDLVLVYSLDSRQRLKPLQLYGYPPWQICLSEIHQHRKWLPWRETLYKDLEYAFRSCLDEYDAAEMRFGK